MMSILKVFSLPRLKGIKNIFSNKITRDNIDAIETYAPNTIDSLVKINIVEPTNTNIKRIIFLTRKVKKFRLSI